MPDVRQTEAEALMTEARAMIECGDLLTAAFYADKAADICRELQEVRFRNRSLTGTQR